MGGPRLQPRRTGRQGCVPGDPSRNLFRSHGLDTDTHECPRGPTADLDRTGERRDPSGPAGTAVGEEGEGLGGWRDRTQSPKKEEKTQIKTERAHRVHKAVEGGCVGRTRGRGPNVPGGAGRAQDLLRREGHTARRPRRPVGPTRTTGLGDPCRVPAPGGSESGPDGHGYV